MNQIKRLGGVAVLEDIEKAYMQYAKDVYRYLFGLSHDRDLAEELTQETFFRAMQTSDNYDGSCKLSVWLIQIGWHVWYQWLGKHSKQKSVELTEEIPGDESPEGQVLLHMEKKDLYKAIHALPESMREVVHMRLTGEFTFGEIGEVLGKSENWVRVAFYRAKQKMIEKMEGLT